MITTILFDLGDVFFFTDFKTINQKMLARTGVPTMADPIKLPGFHQDLNAGKITIDKAFDMLRKSVNSNTPIDVLKSTYSKLYLKYSEIPQEMIKLTKKLKHNYELVCITNTNPLHKELNKARGLFDVFNNVFVSAELKQVKDCDLFKKILRELNLTASECLFIDNLELNVSEARKAGIDSIQFRDYKQLLDELKARNIRVK